MLIANIISLRIGSEINPTKYLGLKVVEPDEWLIIPVAGNMGNNRKTRKTASTTSAVKRPKKLNL